MIAGTTALHSDEGEAACTDCHSATRTHTENGLVASLLNLHTARVACQTCHIPTFSRTQATTMEWYWDEAGEDRTDIPQQHSARPLIDKKKGRFVWGMNVKPVFLWYNGKWEHKIVNANDTYVEAGTVADPVVIAAPTATIADEDAKIYPFKKLIGRQPADTTDNRLVVPHLFGTGPGPESLLGEVMTGAWRSQEGTNYAGQPYSGDYGFVNTVNYLTIHHEVAPKESALGCEDCHGVASFWTNIGMEDPFGS